MGSCLYHTAQHIEGDNFDEEWREHLRRMSGGVGDDMNEDNGPEDVLEQTQQRLETPGQQF